ncbi:hypothetical protein Tco_1476793 [Tanacetum coccineum]
MTPLNMLSTLPLVITMTPETHHPTPLSVAPFTLARRLLALTVAGRHNGKEKVTLNDLFLLHSMDGGVSVDVSWHVIWTDDSGALRGVTLGPETSLLSVAKLVELGICKYNALGYGEMVDDFPEVAEDEGARAGMVQANVGGVRCHPNMTTTNRLRSMDERLGDIETNISRLVGDADELTYVRDHLSQLLAHHHIDHTCYNGTLYAYVPNTPDLGVQQGVNFMSSTPIYSTASSSSPNLFSLFGDDNACPFTSQNQLDDMNED